MSEQTQEYTTQRSESSVRGEMRLAVTLLYEVSLLLKARAARSPDCRPSVRLSKIALGLGEVGHSLQRAASAIELSHYRKRPLLPTDEVDEADLLKADADLTGALRVMPIGSPRSRALFALRNEIRQQLRGAGQSSRGVA